MKTLASSFLSLAIGLGLGVAAPLQAQTATHLGVPSANMVLLSGNFGSGGTSWSVWQNGGTTSVQGHYPVPAGKVLVVTDLVIQMSGGTGSGDLALLFWQNNFQILPAGYLLRFNKTSSVQTFERSFTSGLRIPAGTALDFSKTNFTGTPSLDNVTVYGYFTN